MARASGHLGILGPDLAGLHTIEYQTSKAFVDRGNWHAFACLVFLPFLAAKAKEQGFEDHRVFLDFQISFLRRVKRQLNDQPACA